jgi:hypothetical protein
MINKLKCWLGFHRLELTIKKRNELLSLNVYCSRCGKDF